MTLNIMIQNKYGECFMNEQMKKDILDKWREWKYDIWESNKTSWNQRDQSIAETIDQILLKELDDRKTNDQAYA